ncbi:ABC transporter permease [bacterium]|nr:ABC transporter permease [bacterium]
MNRLRTILYSLNDGLCNLKHGGVTGVVSILTIAFSMLNLGLFLLLWINISPLLKGWMEEVKVLGYLKEGICESRIENLSGELAKMAHVEKVRFVSKSEALERFKETLGEDRSLLEGIEDNPLPASFELVMDDTSGIDALEDAAKRLKAMNEFDDVQSGREWVHRLYAFFLLIKIVGFLVGGVLVFVSIFIISNTVRLTLINRREEIEIMRLVGADRWFISVPFLMEGIINGFLGGAISLGLLYLLYHVLRCKLNLYLLSAIGMLRLSFVPYSAFFLLIVLGMGIGGLGSLFSLKF